MRNILILAILILAATGCTNTKIKMFEKFKGGVPKAIENELTVPFTLQGSHVILVDADFDDHTLPVIIDTGGMTMLENSLADSLQLEKHESPQEGVSLAKIASLKLAKVEVNDLKAVIMPFGDTFKLSKNSIQGMVGSDYLRFFQVAFDYRRNEILFRNSSKLVKENDSDVLMDMKILFPYFPSVKTVINGDLKFNGLIDTGLNYAFVLPYDRLEDMPEHIRQKSIGATGFFAKWPFTTQTRNVMTVLDEVRIGDIVLSDVPVLFADLPGMIDEKTILIGKDFMDDYLVTMDYPKRKVLFQPCDGEEQSILFSTGLNIVNTGKALEVMGIWQNSPAEKAGIALEDKITAVNGLGMVELENRQIRLWLYDPKVESIRITREVDGKLEEIEIEKANLIK